MSDLGEAALRYARAGCPVLPCIPGRKIPATDHGFHDATTDPGQIRAWWELNPRFNVAMVTGGPGRDVLDVDVQPDGNGFAALGRLRRAGLLAGASALVRTRAGGAHLYFAGTAQPCARLPRHHLDFKAAGGYVLMPPSFVMADDSGSAGAYEFLDRRDSRAEIDWQAVRAVLEPPRSARGVGPGPRSDSEALIRWVAAQPSGNRNSGLFWAACRAQGDDDLLGALVAAAVRAGLTGQEAARTVASAGRRAAR